MPPRSCPTPSIGPRGRVPVDQHPAAFLVAEDAGARHPLVRRGVGERRQHPQVAVRDLRARVALDRVRQRLLPLPGTRRAALTNGGTIPDTGQFGIYTTDRRVKLGEMVEGSNWRLLTLDPRQAVLEGPGGQRRRG